jgi:hypothetical protein
MTDGTEGAGLRAFRWWWTALVVAATSVPYLLHLHAAPPGSHYTWIVPPYPEDSLAYRAWSEQAVRGALLFRLKYTALPHRPFLFHPFFLLAGWIAALLSCDIGVVLWVLKGAGVALFFAAFFAYADDLRLSGLQTVIASVLVGVTSGFGGLIALSGLPGPSAISADLWVVDANTFWSLLWNPLFPYALALMVFAVHRLDRGTREGRPPDLWWSGLATGVLALIHPYSQLVLLALAIASTVLRKRGEFLGSLGRFVLPALPSALYVTAVATLHPLASRHSNQGVMTSPAPYACLLGFGLPLLLLAGGLAIGRAPLVRRFGLPLAWFLLSVAFSYLPFWFQRKLVFGAHVPLCLLAGVSAEVILTRGVPRPRSRRRVLAAAAILCAPLLAATPAWLLGAEFREVRENRDGAYFVDDDLMGGLKYLEGHGRPEEVVFATPWVSRLVPAYSGNTVVWGHWAMSVDHRARDDWFINLFKRGSDWSDEKRAGEFWGTGIDFVLVDARLQGWMERNPAAWRSVLAGAEQVYARGSIVIYRRR